MGRYRGRLEIIADMLSVVSAQEGARKTQIMYQANLSYKLLRRYLEEIVEAGLVRCGADHCYRLTRKGRAFLGRFGEYAERRESVEKRLDKVMNEKLVLETTFFDANASKAHRSRESGGADDE